MCLFVCARPCGCVRTRVCCVGLYVLVRTCVCCEHACVFIRVCTDVSECAVLLCACTLYGCACAHACAYVHVCFLAICTHVHLCTHECACIFYSCVRTYVGRYLCVRACVPSCIKCVLAHMKGLNTPFFLVSFLPKWPSLLSCFFIFWRAFGGLLGAACGAFLACPNLSSK